MNFCKIPKDGKLYSITGYTGIKIRYLKKNKYSKEDWTFYIYYRIGGRSGKQYLQKVGTKSQGMTAKKACKIRLQKIIAKEQSVSAGKDCITLYKIWQEYAKEKQNLSSFVSIKNIFAYLEPFYEKSPQLMTTGEIKTFKSDLVQKKENKAKPFQSRQLSISLNY